MDKRRNAQTTDKKQTLIGLTTSESARRSDIFPFLNKQNAVILVFWIANEFSDVRGRNQVFLVLARDFEPPHCCAV